MTLQDFALETITVTVGSSHHLVMVVDEIVPTWTHWLYCNVVVAIIAAIKARLGR